MNIPKDKAIFVRIWGVLVPGDTPPQPGEEVTVHTKSGQTRTIKIDKPYKQERDGWVCTILSEPPAEDKTK